MFGFDLVTSIAIDPPPINGSLYSDIMIQHQKDLLSGKAIEPKKKNKKNPFKKLERVDGKWKLC